jgi:hypothetical protein
MNYFLSLLFLGYLAGCASKKLTIIGQWHLLPTVQTHNIEESKKLPQYANQHWIYDYLLGQTPLSSLTLFAEGCEGEINDNFILRYNGWNFSALGEFKKDKDFEYIMTHVALKLKVIHPEISVICVDDLKLIEKAQLELSNLRAYVGYWNRLKEFEHSKPEKFNAYAESLLHDVVPRPTNATEYAKKMALSSWQAFKVAHSDRNQVIKKNIQKFYTVGRNHFLIIGALHVEEVTQLLNSSISHIDTLLAPGIEDNKDETINSIELFLENQK